MYLQQTKLVTNSPTNVSISSEKDDVRSCDVHSPFAALTQCGISRPLGLAERKRRCVRGHANDIAANLARRDRRGRAQHVANPSRGRSNRSSATAGRPRPIPPDGAFPPIPAHEIPWSVRVAPPAARWCTLWRPFRVSPIVGVSTQRSYGHRAPMPAGTNVPHHRTSRWISARVRVLREDERLGDGNGAGPRS
jgi:hypothetical protein